MEQHRRGFWFGVAGYAIWGVAPVFWKLLDHVPALELTAHRVVWSVPVLGLAIVLLGRRNHLRRSLQDRRTVVVTALAGMLLITNWGIFVWAITSGHIVEASLGYFINPLLSVALGVVVLGERLRRAQVWAVGLAFIGVAYMTVRLGEVPWVSLVLAGSFAVYGLIKKRPEAAPPLEGLLGEIWLGLVPALVVLIALGARGEGAFGVGVGDTVLLIATGAVTAAPLLFFGAAVQRVALSTVGLLQYLAPTLQFILGVVVYGETVVADQLIGFAFVWVALLVFSVDNLRSNRAIAPGPAA